MKREGDEEHFNDLANIANGDLQSESELSEIKHIDWITAVMYSPNGNLIATGSFDKTARVTDLYTGQTICIIQHLDWVYSLSFSPDSTMLATASFENIARVTDLKTCQSIFTIQHND